MQIHADVDISAEGTIPLAEAARLLPPRGDGRATHPATLQRWIVDGFRGVKLEAVRVGGRWLTSRMALQRFAEACAALGRTEKVPA